MEVRIVELILDLTPYMIEYIVAFFGRAQFEVCPERDVVHLVSIGLNLLHLSSGAQVYVLTFLVLNHVSASDTLYYKLRGVLTEVALPQIVTSFESRTVV